MAYGSGSNFALGPSLDRPPAPPTDLLKPGDQTQSILGAPNVNGDGIGVSANTPTGIVLRGVMKMMDGANDVTSVAPGLIPPPIMILIQELMTTAPEVVRTMQQMTGPGGMLSTMGMSMGAGMAPGGMAGGGGGMGAGAPFGEGAGSPQPQMPPMF
jgi:hypothetical protein